MLLSALHVLRLWFTALSVILLFSDIFCPYYRHDFLSIYRWRKLFSQKLNHMPQYYLWTMGKIEPFRTYYFYNQSRLLVYGDYRNEYNVIVTDCIQFDFIRPGYGVWQHIVAPYNVNQIHDSCPDARVISYQEAERLVLLYNWFRQWDDNDISPHPELRVLRLLCIQ